MGKVYSGTVNIYRMPRWDAEGNYSGNGNWKLDFNSVEISQFIVVLEAFLEDLKRIPKRDSKGRFVK